MIVPPLFSVLVVDTEYLIAMDAERILTEALCCQVFVATPARFCAGLVDDRRFDVAVVDAGPQPIVAQALVDSVVGCGIPVVLSSTFREFASTIPALAGFPLVLKPYDENRFIETIVAAGNARTSACARSPRLPQRTI